MTITTPFHQLSLTTQQQPSCHYMNPNISSQLYQALLTIHESMHVHHTLINKGGMKKVVQLATMSIENMQNV